MSKSIMEKMKYIEELCSKYLLLTEDIEIEILYIDNDGKEHYRFILNSNETKENK